jgi:DNA-binding Lrp family transcriptional regulator
MDDRQSRDRLDAIDLRILDELQNNGRIQNNQLADRVGISPPPCLRRVRALFAGGFIKAIRAVLNEKLLGYEIVSFVFVQLDSQAEAVLAAFEAQVKASENVRQCWLVSGENDYVIRCVATDVADMQTIVLGFSTMPNVRTVRSLLVLREVKDAPLTLFGSPVMRAAPVKTLPGAGS